MSRSAINLLLSWSHADRALKEDLVRRLWPNLSILANLSFRWWEDSDIAVGTDWRRTILDECSQCDFAVLLLSPNFFASDFIRDVELPKLREASSAAGLLPVALRAVPLDGSRDLQGLDRLQIFTQRGRAFADCAASARDKFALDLASAIRLRVVRGDRLGIQ